MKLLFLCLLLAMTSGIGTLAYASRLAGVRARSINNSGTLYNMLTLVSRFSNMMILPLVGSLVERAIRTGDLDRLTMEFRYMLLAQAVGILLSGFMIPTASEVFYRMIFKLKTHKSLVMVMRKESTIANGRTIMKLIRIPRWSRETFRLEGIPRRFLWVNLIVHTIYGVGYLAAVYSGALSPDTRLISSNLSGAVNGFATMALYMLIDPVVNVLSDEVMEEKRSPEDLERTVTWLTIGRFVGALFSQILLYPLGILFVWLSVYFN